jgi:hypothetical protein
MGRCCALVLLVMLGCRSVQQPVTRESRTALASSGFVSLPVLAAQLDLAYHGDTGGCIEMSAPPDHVMLVRDSRRALVNGEPVALDQPCMRRGGGYVVAASDAELLRIELCHIRATRAPVQRVSKPGPPPQVHAAMTGLPPEWRPDAGAEPRDWRYIVVHHTATESSDASRIDRDHRAQGWDGLGYHFVIGNGTESGDGEIEVGYRWRQQGHGAHARAKAGDDNHWNTHGIGICLVGNFVKQSPSRRQMDALVRLTRALMEECDIPARNVVPHSKVKGTLCPGPRFPWDEFKARLR